MRTNCNANQLQCEPIAMRTNCKCESLRCHCVAGEICGETINDGVLKKIHYVILKTASNPKNCQFAKHHSHSPWKWKSPLSKNSARASPRRFPQHLCGRRILLRLARLRTIWELDPRNRRSSSARGPPHLLPRPHPRSEMPPTARTYQTKLLARCVNHYRY